MKDNILGKIDDGKCPRCGKKKVICIIQYPIIVELDMKGKPIFRHFRTGKRLYKVSNRRKAGEYDALLRYGEYQCANYKCEACGWISEVYVP